MSFTDFLEKELLDHVFGGNTAGNVYTPPATLYVGLSTTAPQEDGTGITEPSGGNYARVSVANTSTNWSAATGNPSTKSNAQPVTFPQANASWGTVSHFFISDASSGGNIIVKGALTTSKAVGANDTPSFAAGDISVVLD